MRLTGAQVVVIGAGVTGLSAGWWLRQAGVSVAVVDKAIVGQEASGRNGGIVSHRGGEPAVVPLAAESLRLWPTMDERLGYPTEFCPGSLSVAMDTQGRAERIEHARRFAELGIETEWLDAKAVREWVPLISPVVLGALYSRHAGHANPHRATQAFAWAFLDQGGHLYQHTTVTGFRVAGGKITAVETDRGVIGCDMVVCAAGPQTGLLASMVGVVVPVSPARIEMIVTAPVERMWRGAVGNGYLYGRQTLRGNLAYGGGPREWVEEDPTTPRKPNTPLVRNLSRRVAELFPAAADVPVIRAWAGVLEWTPDRLPVVGFVDEPANFLVANVSGHGFGLSPATGKVVSELVLGGESSVPIEALAPRRFAGVGKDWRRRWGWEPAAERA